MWFKQITCDNCHILLSKKSIDNCYVSIRYTDKKTLFTDVNYKEYIPFSEQYIFNYATFNKTNPSGKLFIYKPNPEDMQFKVRSMFCSNKCAYEFCKNKNILLLHLDKKLNSIRTVCYEMTEINRALGGEPFRGLFTNWGPNWVVNFPEEDLERYNFSGSSLPKYESLSLEISPITEMDNDDYFDIFIEKGFMSSFDRYYNESYFIKNFTKAESLRHIESYILASKRRTGAMWKLSVDSKLIGFIRLNYSDRWMIEFGVLSKYRRNGYTSKALKIILNWCKTNGLTEIFSIVEYLNQPSRMLLEKFNFASTEMTDKSYDGTVRKTIGYSLQIK